LTFSAASPVVPQELQRPSGFTSEVFGGAALQRCGTQLFFDWALAPEVVSLTIYLSG